MNSDPWRYIQAQIVPFGRAVPKEADYLHVELCKPGQPAPYSQFPFIALAA